MGESCASPANLRAAHNLSHSVNYNYGDDDCDDYNEYGADNGNDGING